MKQTGSYETRSVSPLRLYLDDYDQLIELIGRDRREVTVLADNWQLDSPDEIARIKQATMHCLEINSFVSNGILSSIHSMSSFSVTVTGRKAIVCFINGPEGGKGVALQVLEFLQEKRSNTERLKSMAVFLPLLAVPVLIVRVSQGWEHLDRSILLDGFALLGCVLLTGRLAIGRVWWCIRKSLKSVALVLKRRSEETNFWGRNRDDLIKKTIYAVVGAIGGWVLRSLWPR
jgi:hypothetical protein